MFFTPSPPRHLRLKPAKKHAHSLPPRKNIFPFCPAAAHFGNFYLKRFCPAPKILALIVNYKYGAKHRHSSKSAFRRLAGLRELAGKRKFCSAATPAVRREFLRGISAATPAAACGHDAPNAAICGFQTAVSASSAVRNAGHAAGSAGGLHPAGSAASTEAMATYARQRTTPRV